ncbi:MAG TPA: hypothetical protein VFH47_05080 [Candidatus Thermoplasmatota archaeon]|nr:hypothetical protein [Candidatus Thermoplasmatota archaeon]
MAAPPPPVEMPDAEVPLTTEAPSPLLTVPVSHAGRLPGGAVWAGPFGHVGALFSDDHIWRKEVPGTLQSAQLTMVWDGGPTTQRLDLVLGPLERRDGVLVLSEDVRRVSGTSPLVLSAEGMGWTQGDYVVLGWWPDEPGVRVEDVAFQVDGILVSVLVEEPAGEAGER